MPPRSNNPEANRLFDEGLALERTDEDAAVTKYEAALQLVDGFPGAAYNIGLIRKYQGRWQESLRWNQLAMETDPEDPAAKWNTGIAATALGDWATARAVWTACKLPLDGKESGPILTSYGVTPVRLNPNSEGEVVSAERMCPVRAKILSIPFPESGFHYRDVVLHDGAPVGFRVRNGTEYPVFNVLERLEVSSHQTFAFGLSGEPSESAWETLLETLREIDGDAEFWSASVRLLCVACSEGRPHEACEPVPVPQEGPHRFGVALERSSHLSVVQEWAQQHGFELSP